MLLLVGKSISRFSLFSFGTATSISQPRNYQDGEHFTEQRHRKADQPQPRCKVQHSTRRLKLRAVGSDPDCGDTYNPHKREHTKCGRFRKGTYLNRSKRKERKQPQTIDKENEAN
jgi:Ni/Co efflux regulator RcnB